MPRIFLGLFHLAFLGRMITCFSFLGVLRLNLPEAESKNAPAKRNPLPQGSILACVFRRTSRLNICIPSSYR